MCRLRRNSDIADVSPISPASTGATEEAFCPKYVGVFRTTQFYLYNQIALRRVDATGRVPTARPRERKLLTNLPHTKLRIISK